MIVRYTGFPQSVDTGAPTVMRITTHSAWDDATARAA